MPVGAVTSTHDGNGQFSPLPITIDNVKLSLPMTAQWAEINRIRRNNNLPSQVESLKHENWLHMTLCFFNFIMLSINCGTAAGFDHVILMQSAISQ